MMHEERKQCKNKTRGKRCEQQSTCLHHVFHFAVIPQLDVNSAKGAHSEVALAWQLAGLFVRESMPLLQVTEQDNYETISTSKSNHPCFPKPDGARRLLNKSNFDQVKHCPAETNSKGHRGLPCGTPTLKNIKKKPSNRYQQWVRSLPKYLWR